MNETHLPAYCLEVLFEDLSESPYYAQKKHTFTVYLDVPSLAALERLSVTHEGRQILAKHLKLAEVELRLLQ